MLLFSLLPIFYLDLWFSAAKVLWLQMSFIPIHSVRICWPSWILKFAFNQILNSLKTSFFKIFFLSCFYSLPTPVTTFIFVILLDFVLYIFEPLSACILFSLWTGESFLFCCFQSLFNPFINTPFFILNIKAFRSIFSYFMKIHLFKFLNIL